MLTGRTLNQILDVLRHLRVLIKSGNDLEKSYHQAVKRVSQKYDVSYQTIGDSCRRRLDLKSIEKFRELVTEWLEGNSEELKRVLREKTDTSQHVKIDEFLNDPDSWNSNGIKKEQIVDEQQQKERLEIELSHKEIRYLNALSELEGEDVKELIRIFIKEGVRSRITKIADDII